MRTQITKLNSKYTGATLSGPTVSENKVLREYSGLPNNVTKYVALFHTNTKKEYKL